MPARVNSAASTPARAAAPTSSTHSSEPEIQAWLWPPAAAAATEIALTVCGSSSPSATAALAAAPNGPKTPDGRRPRPWATVEYAPDAAHMAR